MRGQNRAGGACERSSPAAPLAVVVGVDECVPVVARRPVVLIGVNLLQAKLFLL